ncbi:hypothetical protein JCM8547_006274 [Rhodosporidiobolus lusitaniae]
MSSSASARPADSQYFSTTLPPALAVLNLPDTEAYLERIGLPTSLASAPPSLELLEKLLIHQHLSIPFSSASIHVPAKDWIGENKAIELRRGPGMELGRKNFERVILKRQGGYCYSTNPLCAAFLRGFGFRVSEIGARVYLHRGKDPRQAGIWWSQMTHVALLVDWEGSEERWLFDIGFGGGASPIPIALRDGATCGSLSPSESFMLKKESLPIGDLTTIIDPPQGWTLYRRVVPDGVTIEDHAKAGEGPGYWTPAQHLTIATIAPEDMVVADFYSSKHPEAAWTNAFISSLLLPNGARRTLVHGISALQRGAPDDEKTYAKLYTKGTVAGKETDVEWVPFETGPIREVLGREFGYRF